MMCCCSAFVSDSHSLAGLFDRLLRAHSPHAFTRPAAAGAGGAGGGVDSPAAGWLERDNSSFTNKAIRWQYAHLPCSFSFFWRSTLGS